jgi:hypothetical protein
MKQSIKNASQGIYNPLYILLLQPRYLRGKQGNKEKINVEKAECE